MSLLDHVRKIFVEEARGTVTDTRPLYAAAGILDYAVEFVRGVPTRLEEAAEQVQAEWTPERFGDAFSDLVDSASPDKVRARGQEVRERVADTLKDRRDAVVDDLADLSVDARNLPAQVRDRARQAPGRAAVEIANQVGAVFELYDTAVDRGRLAVARLRGDAAPNSAPSPANRPPDPATDGIEPVTRPRPSAVTPPITHPPVAQSPSGDQTDQLTDRPSAVGRTGSAPTDAAPGSVAPTGSPAPAPTGVPSPSSIPSTAPLRRPRATPRTAPGAAMTPAGSPVVRRPRKQAQPPAATGPGAPPPAASGPGSAPPALTGSDAPASAPARPGGGPATGIGPDTGIGSPPSPRRAPRSPRSPRPAAGPVPGAAGGSTADEAASPATGTRPRTPRTTVRPPG